MRLREARKAAGLTQVQLAQRAGMSQGYLSDLETGEIPRPAVQSAVSLVAVLRGAGIEVTVEELFAPAGEAA